MFRHAFLLVAALSFFLFPSTGHAAVLFTDPPSVEVRPGGTFQLDIAVDTQGQDINALEGKILFPAEILKLKEVRDGNSIINFWVERPTVSDAPVSFSGIIPGGYQFPRGFILTLVFEANAEGQGVVAVDAARVLLNDGNGTQAPLSLAPTMVRVASDVTQPAPGVEPIMDTVPPELFVPVLAQDPLIFDGAWFLSFATQDKGSGIDHYEIRESAWWGNGFWKTGTSPYRLLRQDPARSIFVKAVDKAGNERVVMVQPIGEAPFPYEICIVLGILLVIVSGAGYIFWKRRRAARR